MKKVHDKKVATLIHKLGLKYKLSDEVIKQLVESQYEFSAEVIKNLKLDDVKTEEELNNIKTNFMYRGFAKLFINPGAFKKRVEKRNKYNK